MATDGWGVTEWKITSTRVFRDLFKHATYWQVERARHDAGVQMETWKQYGLRPTNMSHANGYPVSLPRWWLWQNSFEVQTAVAYIGWGGASVAAGQYAVHFNGNGTLSFGGDALLAAPLSYDPVAMRGRYLFNVSAPATGVSIRIMTTDPSAPLENVRILRVEDELRSAGSGSGSTVSAITSINVDATDAALADQPFHPDLLNALNGTRLLRFCGWALIDSNDYNENNFRPAWRDRSTPASLTQAGPRGVALEYMVALANTLNASAWFCMPRSNAMDPSLMTTSPNRPGAADEADLMTYASYVDSHLRPHLTAFVEYRTDAANRNEAPQTHAIESLEVFRAWTLAFGVNARRRAALGTRLVRVSAAGAWLGGTLERFGTDLGNVDAVAVRAVFGRSNCCNGNCQNRYNQCINFDDRERAAEFYANWTVDALVRFPGEDCSCSCARALLSLHLRLTIRRPSLRTRCPPIPQPSPEPSSRAARQDTRVGSACRVGAEWPHAAAQPEGHPPHLRCRWP